MHTFNSNPTLMIELATVTRADQLERAARRRAHHPDRLEAGARRRGYWGGLHHRSTSPASARVA